MNYVYYTVQNEISTVNKILYILKAVAFTVYREFMKCIVQQQSAIKRLNGNNFPFLIKCTAILKTCDYMFKLEVCLRTTILL